MSFLSICKLLINVYINVKTTTGIHNNSRHVAYLYFTKKHFSLIFNVLKLFLYQIYQVPFFGIQEYLDIFLPVGLSVSCHVGISAVVKDYSLLNSHVNLVYQEKKNI